MKKILILMLCAILFCCVPLMVSAEEVPPETTETEETTPGTEETPTDTEEVSPTEETPPAEEAPPVEETPTEDVVPPVEDPPAEDVPEEPEMTLPDKIVNFITTNYDSSTLIGFAITLIVYLIYGIKQYKSLGGKIGILNNNAVKIAEDSNKAIDASFVEVKGIAENSISVVKEALGESKTAVGVMLSKAENLGAVVESFGTIIETFLERIGDIETDKAATRDALLEASKVMEACKKAVLEDGNMVAELLMLANIPNSKKEEIYARHLSAVNAIAEAEKSEVATDDGKET